MWADFAVPVSNPWGTTQVSICTGLATGITRDFEWKSGEGWAFHSGIEKTQAW